MAATHTLPLASPGMARICLYGDLQRFGRRIDLRVKTGAEAIRALAMQIPAFRQKLSDGWYRYALPGVMQVKPNCLPVLMSRWKMVP